MIQGFCFSIALAFSLSALAKTADLGSLAKDLEKTKARMNRIETETRQMKSGLFHLNKKMKKLVSEKGELENERQVVESGTKEVAGQLVTLETKVRSQRELLRQRISAISKFGGQGLARFLLSSSNSAELERNLKILGSIAGRDLSIIKEYSANAKELEKKRDQFTRRLAKLKSVESKILDKEARLEVEQNLKKEFLQKARQSQAFAMNKLKGLRAETKKMIQEDDTGSWDLLLRPSFLEQKGKLPMPVAGSLEVRFGAIRDTEFNVYLSQKGIILKTPQGAKVHSVFPGRVAFAGALQGYGEAIVLDHGDHYYTVYGNNRQLLVKEGDEVKGQQQIAESGASLLSANDGIYFEVRHFSEPDDPQSWLKEVSL